MYGQQYIKIIGGCPINEKVGKISCRDPSSYSAKNFATFCATEMFITAFRRTSHWSLPWVRKIYCKSAIFFFRTISVLLCHSRLIIEVASVFQILLQKFCMHFFTLLCVLRCPPFSSSLIWLPQWYLSKIKNYEAPHYATVCNFLLLDMYASYS